MKKQRGVALVLVLFLTAIMIILAINILKQAQSQVKQSELMKDKMLAYSDVYSAKSTIVFELLTRTPQQLSKEKGWDFAGENIQIANSEVKIQDLNGLLNIYGFISHKVFASVLSQCGIRASKATKVSKQVLSKHSGDENLPIDKYQRLFYLLGTVNTDVKQCIDNNITRFSGAIFNPATATKEYLVAKLGVIRAIKVLNARSISNQELSNVVNDISPDDAESNQRNTIGPYFRVTLTSRRQDSIWSEMIEIKFSHHIIKKPLIFLGYSPR
ncbi:hypothetical protein [Colwellia sp. RSH04]|uniref:hypothetical protein n=1 Tax=Colwellia sp. RSH04 TaxID=2305464 RepID=UPI000E5848A7|nr:hypothetical protein [Colwellia sp. RSH04]RHW74872.1 hypothetical protein D1094_16480 [Colwellia sp. RSH04]